MSRFESAGMAPPGADVIIRFIPGRMISSQIPILSQCFLKVATITLIDCGPVRRKSKSESVGDFMDLRQRLKQGSPYHSLGGV